VGGAYAQKLDGRNFFKDSKRKIVARLFSLSGRRRGWQESQVENKSGEKRRRPRCATPPRSSKYTSHGNQKSAHGKKERPPSCGAMLARVRMTKQIDEISAKIAIA